MGKLEDVLELIKAGVTNEREIAERLGLSSKEVEDIIKILESLGYVEKVEFGSKACETCPLKKVCYGSCLRPTGAKAFKLTEKAFSLER
ncbi:LexA-related DNA-binding protein [Thermococcus kodakarensis KOD1]|uniref:LexA-related DNA-binding protein n=1 Tax=Thermococcus kodakarensis (strain ATCC BAA-918 / JCM 12380 / KOD1) TaxID=69014 RepID=Q5JI96_THEKO|nr:winged helix-turn-helix transcriptional regulator [Thermococcus kodakarensis]WCN28934.1 winged helix-turn-helix transcriptional regulator [Thermococcus kodakarensis]WCN31238.1 winged helix-turn-helix transcriptional regulator [Thermococcus kodakarensis]BAD85145.1 LexA-related DNA-binding protein [Thermococcus kodakarensis KOD1]